MHFLSMVMGKRLFVRTVLTLTCLLFAGTLSTAFSQVDVEKSKDKIIISGTAYYIHIVRKGETAYSISRAYGVTLDELYKNNQSAAAGLKEGQALRIPVVEAPHAGQVQKPLPSIQQQRDESKFFYHKMKPGDTVYSLAKYYGVSVGDIIAANPGIDINKLPVNYEIAVPRRELTTTPKTFEVASKDYLEHKVVRGESLSSIAEKYGITVRELRRENRGVIFPSEGDLLKIPVSRIVEPVAAIADTLQAREGIPEEKDFELPTDITPVKNLRGKFNVAVLLPFYILENSVRTEIDSLKAAKGKPVYKTSKKPDEWLYPPSVQFIEMYQGILMAADILRSLGLDLNVYAYDTRGGISDVEHLVLSGKLKEMNLIIGPVYSPELVRIAAYAGEQKIPVVSPVPLKNNQPLKNNPYLFMAIPSVEVAQHYIARHTRQFNRSNFVFVHNDVTGTNPEISGFRNHIIREITAVNNTKEISFKELLFISRSALSTDSINRLEQALSPRMENIVIIASEDYPVLSETIMDIHTLSRKYSIRLLGYPAVRELVNLDPKLYFDLGIELYSHYWIDYRQNDVIEFLKKYRIKYLSEPPESSYAWQGYDIMYYFVTGLAIHGKRFINRPEIHNPDLLATKFYFRQKTNEDGFENYHLYLLKYLQSMDIIVLDEESKTP